MMNRPFAIVVALIFSVVGHAQEVVEAPERLENVIITFTEFGRDSINQIKRSFVVRGQGELEGFGKKVNLDHLPLITEKPPTGHLPTNVWTKRGGRISLSGGMVRVNPSRRNWNSGPKIRLPI